MGDPVARKRRSISKRGHEIPTFRQSLYKDSFISRDRKPEEKQERSDIWKGSNDIPESAPAITISEDFSRNDKVEKRKFLALQDRVNNTVNNTINRLAGPRPERAVYNRAIGIPRIPTIRKRKRSEFQPGSNPSEIDKNALNLDITELKDYIARLQKRAKQLEESTSNPNFQVLYRIPQEKESDDDSLNDGNQPSHFKRLYFDEPQWLNRQYGEGILRCRSPVENFDLFLERNKDISFIVYKTYVVSEETPKTSPKFTLSESIQPIHEDLIKAIHSVLELKEEYTEINQGFGMTRELHPPYLFVFHERNEWDSIQSSLSKRCQKYMKTLWDYIIQRYGHEYVTAHACISMITSRYVNYLFKPGQTLVQRKGNQYIGWVARSWARLVKSSREGQRNAAEVSQEEPNMFTFNRKNTLNKMGNGEIIIQEWSIDAWNWVFDGGFLRQKGVLKFYIRASANAKEIMSTRSEAMESVSDIASGEHSTPITEHDLPATYKHNVG